MRRAAFLSLALMLSCGSDDSPGGPAPGCTPGQQFACSCTDGSPGFKVCLDTGDSFGDCTCAEPTDGGADHSVDSPADGKVPDTSQGDGGTPCVHPVDGLDQPTWPVPTPGACAGDAAVVCDPASHLLVTTGCKSGEKCITFDVHENPDPMTYTQQGRVFTWAACVPDGAAACTWSWKAQSGSYPPGWWESDFTNACVSGAVQRCLMPAVPDDPAYGAMYAGTTTGYVEVRTCDTGEECADDPTYPGNPDCFASPLVACDPPDSKCTGNVLFDCYGYPYQKKVDCAATGQVCREDCDTGLPFKAASCRPDLPSGATACDPAAFTPSCSNADTIHRCDECFLQAGTCQCYGVDRACDQVGCGWSSDCKCADVTSGGTTTSQCIDSTYELCDEATTQDACNGTTARRCVGYLVEVDCTKYGEVCQLASGMAGCAASPATTCSDTLARSCSGNVLSGCCPANGLFQTDAYVVPCAPGYLVKMDCSTLYAPFKCQSMPSGAECMM